MNAERIQRFYELRVENRALMEDVFVAVPCRPHDGVAIELHNMLCAWHDLGVQHKVKEDSMAGFIENTRMFIAHRFLTEMRQKYLLMIDNDTEPCLELPWLLARHNEAIVGSCIVSMSPAGRPMLCFSRADAAGIPRFIDYQDGDKVPAMGLAEVPHCGTGAMMIRRDVLEAFTMEKDGDDWDVPFLLNNDRKVKGMKTGRLLEGEDIRFCKQARAKGYKVKVDMEAHCSHRKMMRMSFPERQRDPSLSVEDWFAPTAGMAMTNE